MGVLLLALPHLQIVIKAILYQGILLYIFIYLYYLAQFFVFINAWHTRAPFSADLY